MPRRARPRLSAGITPPAAARRAPFPGFIEPCHAASSASVPEGAGWAHEIKFDGYRTQAHLSEGRARLYTRRGYDWTRRFASVAAELTGLSPAQAIFDGEIIVADERGNGDFHLLQEDLAQGRTDRLTYVVFDLLYLDGFDFRPAPLRERKAALQKLLGRGRTRVIFSAAIDAGGGNLFQRACQLRLEGIVSKRLDEPYRSGRQDIWRKTKCEKTDTFPIVAFVEKLGVTPRRAASLYVGRRDGDRLLYTGKVQTGFTQHDLRALRERLDPYIRRTSPLSVPVKKPKATWVEPVLQAEVRYSAFTSDGLLRAPVYKGLRDDLAPESATPKAAARGSTSRSGSRGVPSINILQLLPDAVVPSRDALETYWKRVYKSALPFLARRPLKLVRHVRGTTFYHKGPLPPVPAGVHELKVRKREGGEGTRLWVDDSRGLLGLLDIGAVELHPWNCVVDDIEHADVLVFDLDPGPGIEWPFLVETALVLRELLRHEGFEPWPKVTGGKGIHLMAPLPSPITHDEAHEYSRKLAETLARTDRSRFTTTAAPAARRGRLFIDYLRNGRGTTAVGTYSPRARPGFPIAAPVTWKEIERGIQADAFTIHHPPRARATPAPQRRLAASGIPHRRPSAIGR